MNRLLPLLLLAPLALAGEADPDRLVAELGSGSYDVREAAQADLMKLGEKAWPELEAALESADPEVKERAGALLKAWGWIPPPLRSSEADALRGRDIEARKAVVERWLEAGLKDSLEGALAGAPVRLGLVLPPGRRSYGVGAEAAVEGEIRNLSPHPGWLPAPRLEARPMPVRPFGRAVAFPPPRTGGRRQLTKSHG